MNIDSQNTNKIYIGKEQFPAPDSHSFKNVYPGNLQKKILRKYCARVNRSFNEHPHSGGESYLQHLGFTLGMSAHFLYLSLIIACHGVFPFLFTRTTSSHIEKINGLMQKRVAATLAYAEKQNTPRIAIAGGGFSGALALANLIGQAKSKLVIDWFEPASTLGTGVAYGSGDATHLLNVRADRMGAFEGKPEGFYQWLQSDEGRSCAERIWPGHAINPDSYVPRSLYGEYVQSIVKAALTAAQKKHIDVQLHSMQLLRVDRHYADANRVALQTNRWQMPITVDALILATGNHAPQPVPVEGKYTSDRYINDIWNTPPGHIYPSHMDQLPADFHIVIIGTGLTMADAVLTLKARGYQGKITAISRRGLLPGVHQAVTPYPSWEWSQAPQFAPRTALGLLRRLREEIRHALSLGYDWRAVVDSLRPVTTQIWQQLSLHEKQRFMKRLLTFWNIHRHRMAPEVAEALQLMMAQGNLRIEAAKIEAIRFVEKRFQLKCSKRGAKQSTTYHADLLINCTGPNYDVTTCGNTLLKNLLKKEMVTASPLRYGLADSPEQERVSNPIFPMGSLLVGEQLECTAVPELRGQAHAVATQVLLRLQLMYERGVISPAISQWKQA